MPLRARLACASLFAVVAAAAAAAAGPRAAKLFPNSNNIAGQVPGPKQSTAHIQYAGMVETVGACADACTGHTALAPQAKAQAQEQEQAHRARGFNCSAFTWHAPDFAAGWAKQCYIRDDGVWAPQHQDQIESGLVWTRSPPPPPPPPPPTPAGYCAACNYNGRCSGGSGAGVQCACDAAWRGAACDALALDATAAELGYQGVDPANGGNLTSWGGSVVIGDDGMYHMYAAPSHLPTRPPAAPGRQPAAPVHPLRPPAHQPRP